VRRADYERRLRAGTTEADYASIHVQQWPAYDPALIVDETVTIVVQVNGKVRDKLDLAPDVAEDEVRERALASAKVQSAMEGRALKKFIYVPGRLASVVV
jgi:leucyl-tRNA synthetase